MSELTTQEMLLLLGRIRANDPTARERLLAYMSVRLQVLSRALLGRFPALKVHEETHDVLYGAMPRLLNSLGRITPESTADLYRWAAAQIRRQLLDRVRYYQRHPDLIGLPAVADSNGELREVEPADPEPGLDDLQRWAAFHEAAEKLPGRQGEVFGLVFYSGLRQQEIAELLDIDVRTVRRDWTAACEALNQALDSHWPEL